MAVSADLPSTLEEKKSDDDMRLTPEKTLLT